MINKHLFFIAICILNITLIGCTRNLSPDSYDGRDIGQPSTVKKGIIIGRRAVMIDNKSGMGGLAGVAGGAAAGSAIGGSTASNLVGMVGGALVGGVLGNSIDSAINKSKGFEYLIKLDTGKTISVVQIANPTFFPKQHVVIIYGRMTRIMADSSYES